MESEIYGIDPRSSSTTTSPTSTSRPAICPACHAGQGQFPARAVRHELCPGRQLGRREISDPDGRRAAARRRRFSPRLQIHFRHAAAGRRLFRQHHHDAGQARAQGAYRRAGGRRRRFDVSVAKGTRKLSPTRGIEARRRRDVPREQHRFLVDPGADQSEERRRRAVERP